uniref:Uncharacterized protein MANES_09G079800 n=1 Tax=Rhizophora mucronata TaxID=61149 RepID=A0A2P2J0B5_RHIMU
MNALAPGYPWDETSMLINSSTATTMPSQDEFTILQGSEADIGSKGVTRISNNSGGTLGAASRTPAASSEIPTQGRQATVLCGIPDFAEVYSFIGAVFDPDTKGHVQKLKEMDPINYETVLLLMRNLTVNLSSPDFEPVRKVLSSYDVTTKTVGVAAKNQFNEISC